MKIVLAAEYSDEVSASIAKGMLEANGINSIIEGSNMVRLYFGAEIWNPVRLMVREDDLEAAKKLLAEHGDI
ncbi:MAG: DUF2007 domain-containing protein [Muribaculaceae bacterium]|nr:DUF2007 domain-containing protein [Muribaculaceae bacterium]